MPSREELAKCIRVLSMDAVQKASSGHPGAPMGMADMAEVLWNDFLKHDPNDPHWPDRDRFVLSNGHASMLLYALLHLSGYDLTIEDLKQFRQLHSRTPGHPEVGLTPGVETTTGPLGQGLANAVGMALAEKMLAAQFNRNGHRIVDHFTYVCLGDGCLMEGISHEACSLAGTLGLGKLIGLYDDNGISIDGKVEGWFTEDVPQRFRAYGWHVIGRVDGHDPDSIRRAIQEAREVADRPSLICLQTQIAFGSPHMAGSHKTHGAPLGEDEIDAARQHLGWSHEPFFIPEELYAGWDARDKGAFAHKEWNERFAAYKAEHPELAEELLRRMRGDLPGDFAQKAVESLQRLSAKGGDLATRKASKQALEEFGPLLPELVGGSADLSGSNNTEWSGSKTVSRADADGNYIHFGVREFAMAAITNGIALHGGFIPYAGTFLVFSDYARNAIRLAALMRVRSLFVLTHDSIGVGEDGPTHQPIEQAASLRLMPNLTVWRPCDGVETAAAWKWAAEHRSGPSALLLTRQKTRHQERSEEQLQSVERGGYVLFEPAGEVEALIIATGSEVEPSMDAAKALQEDGCGVRVVSMPSVEVFEAQEAAYQQKVLPKEIRVRLAVEAGVTDGWHRFVGDRGACLGVNRFGESAPGGELFTYFGLTKERIVEAVRGLLQ
jgi:transketolase